MDKKYYVKKREKNAASDRVIINLNFEPNKLRKYFIKKQRLNV